MAEEMTVKEIDEVVVRFSGDSGDGMQLAGNMFSIYQQLKEMISVHSLIIRQIFELRKVRLQVFQAFRFI